MAFAGVLVGMAAEAACLAGLGDAVRVGCSGARPGLARSRCEALVARGATALVSFGIAGALQPGLRPGTLLLPRRVVTAGLEEEWPAAPGWHRKVVELAAAAGLALLSEVSLAGSDTAVAGAAGKAELAGISGAAAVDMESHILAAVAARHGLPFLVLRAIADPAERGIPGPALAGLSSSSSVSSREWRKAGAVM